MTLARTHCALIINSHHHHHTMKVTRWSFFLLLVPKLDKVFSPVGAHSTVEVDEREEAALGEELQRGVAEREHEAALLEGEAREDVGPLLQLHRLARVLREHGAWQKGQLVSSRKKMMKKKMKRRGEKVKEDHLRGKPGSRGAR